MSNEKVLKQIVDELEAQSVYDEYASNCKTTESQKTRLGVMGQPSSGKTSFTNALLGTKLPVSVLPSEKEYHISYGESASTNVDGTSTEIKSDNNWLKQQNIDVVEINANILADEAKPIDFYNLYAKCDVCVFLMNTQAALNRTELVLLQGLQSLQIPTMIVLSRGDLLTENDYTDVLGYIKNNIQDFSCIQIVEGIKNLSDAAAKDLQDQCTALLAKADVTTVRNNIEKFYLGYALSQLFEICQSKITACAEKQRDIEKLAVEKEQKLNEKITDWLALETRLRQSMNETSNKFRAALEKRESDMVRRLSHDVDVCGDIKLFWEKDFSFRLEEMIKAETASVAQLINQELVRTMQWLQDELLKQFHCRMALNITCMEDESQAYTLNNPGINVTDTNRLKIVTRIGTVATVIAVGTLFATSGIAGIVMAAGMASGLGAEYFMRKRTNESKERIKQYLPDIVAKAQVQMTINFEQKLQDVTNQLVAQMQDLKGDWRKRALKDIEQEKDIALYNFSPNKWESVMGKINQLSEIILN